METGGHRDHELEQNSNAQVWGFQEEEIFHLRNF